jgi:hypothetical protein
MKKTLYFLSMLFILFTACSKEKTEYIDNAPQLEITVVDISHTAVANARVTLYASETDLKTKTNSLLSGTSNAEGIALFAELEEEVYYFYAEKAEMNNTKSISLISENLQINVKATVQTIIK